MALQKKITSANGMSGDYIRLARVEYDVLTDELKGTFVLYGSQALRQSRPNMPLGVAGKLIIKGADFADIASADGPTAAKIYQAVLNGRGEIKAGLGLTADEFNLRDARSV